MYRLATKSTQKKRIGKRLNVYIRQRLTGMRIGVENARLILQPVTHSLCHEPKHVLQRGV